MNDYPGVMKVEHVIAQLKLLFPDQEFVGLPWELLTSRMSNRNLDLASLQAYWVDSQVAGQCGLEQGPQWSVQRRKVTNDAARGVQRALSNAKRGMPSLLNAGLGPEEHLRQALALQHPFDGPAAVDDDVSFAVRVMVILGFAVRRWREQQTGALARVAKALEPLDTALRSHMHKDVLAVAASKSPATIAVVTVLLR
jgi:hypothetical protein